jgi:hypothetical protein
MKHTKATAPSKQENSKGIAEAAIDLSRSEKDGTWEDIVRKGAHHSPYSKAAHSPVQPEAKETIEK